MTTQCSLSQSRASRCYHRSLGTCNEINIRHRALGPKLRGINLRFSGHNVPILPLRRFRKRVLGDTAYRLPCCRGLIENLSFVHLDGIGGGSNV